MMSFCTCIKPGQGRDLPSCPLCPMVPWKDMSDPGKAWQDKKVFPDGETQLLTIQKKINANIKHPAEGLLV